MNNFELEKISDAATLAQTASSLLGSFFEEYFSELDYADLKFDAEHRPEIIAAKVFAIREICYQIELNLDSITDPQHSPIVASYLKDAQRTHDYMEEGGKGIDN